ncbi:MAG: choice-of-anchor D domain-containing protein, partial [Acidobacteriia bacterium]|nr:choice-of-anchor D domain-containing protein [Terriglobia bacterium]
MKEEKVTTKRVAVLAFLTILCLALPTFAKQAKTVTKGPIVIQEFKHDTGPLLREVAPLLPEYGTPGEHEIPNKVNPNYRRQNNAGQEDPVLQKAENSPSLQTPNFSLEFEGISDANSFCNCEPPDNDGAPGLNQYVQYINVAYEVFDKSGNQVLGPLRGNSFWSGFGGSCQADNSGDPIVRFDAMAQRWVVSQFAINSSGNDFECVAVSTTSDATGSYNRYAFSFAAFPDYPKMSVWPDAYYFTFNNFNLAGTAFLGANVCAADRSKMLTGAAATLQCFAQTSNDFGMLPSDLDGPTPPPAGTPNFVMELDPSGSANIDMFKFHVDFVTPTNSTFTGPTLIPIASYTDLCPTQQRGRCVKQPTSGSDLLESLAGRLMFRLVYRNFPDHSVLLTSHSVQAGTSGGVRWYEIRTPETGPTVFQQGTFAPDSQYRWMPGIAMDAQQNIAVGFSRSGSASGQFPSLVYAGRVPSDAAGTLESEVTLLAGTGSQTGGGDRWGDYTGMAIDPVDDCTFWFTEQYQTVNGGFDWHTAVGTFSFPGCSGGGTPDFSLSANPNTVTITQGGNPGTSTITVTPFNGFNGSVTLSASGLPTGVTAGFAPNPTTTTSTLTLTASATATVGTSTVTINGVSGSLNHSTTLQLTVNQSGGGPAVTLTPTSLTWGKVVVGTAGATKTVTVTNTGIATLHFGTITTSGDFALAASPKPCSSTLAVGVSCKIKVTFTPTQLGVRTGTLTINDDAANSPQTVPLSGTGVGPATLTPTSATYAVRKVGTTSAAKTFTLTNKQSAFLTGITVATTGDFAVSAQTCPGSLPPTTSCTISVT